MTVATEISYILHGGAAKLGNPNTSNIQALLPTKKNVGMTLRGNLFNMESIFISHSIHVAPEGVAIFENEILRYIVSF